MINIRTFVFLFTLFFPCAALAEDINVLPQQDIISDLVRAFFDGDLRSIFAAALMFLLLLSRRFKIMKIVEAKWPKGGPFFAGLILSAIPTVSVGLSTGMDAQSIIGSTIGLWLMGMGAHSVKKRADEAVVKVKERVKK